MRRLASVLFLCAVAAPVRAQPTVERALEHTARGGAWPRALLLESAREVAGVTASWPRAPRLGEGATVCVVDTGVDLAHPTFRDEAGRTRARWVLDLDRAPLGLHGELEARFGGAVLDAADVDARLDADDPSLADRHGHGTAIAAAVLGDDATTGPAGAFAGVAPRASLVVVRALREGLAGLLDEDVLTGARFCAEVMDRERGVLLFALGGHDGAHDGSEPLEAGLASLARRWVVVTAAGNDGGPAIHAGGAVSPDAWAALELFVPDVGPRAAHLVLSVRGASRLVLETPGGARVTRQPGARTEVGAVVIDARSPRATYVVLRGDPSAPLRGGVHRLHFSGEIDAWITEQDLGDGTLDRPAFEGPFATDAETVAIPATEPSTIAIGALVSRVAWPSETGGEGLAITPEAITGRAPFSARGPAASGWARPDLLAPGALVRTALSTTLEVGEGRLFSDAAELERFRRGEGVVLAGTSVAAGIVAGAIALASAESPVVSPEHERAALLVGAGDPLGLGDPVTLTLDVGGYLDARTARGGVPSPVRSSVALSRSAVRPRSGRASVQVLVRDAAGAPVEGDVQVLGDGVVLTQGRAIGGAFRALLPTLAHDVGTTVEIEAWMDGVRLGGASLSLAPDERGAAVVPRGGGCAAGAPVGGPVWLLALAGLLGALWLRRSRD